MINTSSVENLSYYDTVFIYNKEDLLNSINRIEKLIRTSKEYKAYIRAVRETDDIKGCAFFLDKNMEEVDLEIHHLIHLYDLCLIAGEKLLDNLKENEVLLCMDVAKEVLNLHFKDMVPLISLSTTLHQLLHADQYTLPRTSKQLHLGNYTEFIKSYKKYLNKEYVRAVYTYFKEVDKEEFGKFLDKVYKS